MKFGCTLPTRGPLATANNLRKLATHAEALGFHCAWVSDHIVIPRQVGSAYPYAATGASPFDADATYCDAITTLAYMAACAKTIRLGIHVLILPYRNPVLTAKMVATLDHLSGGRMTLGVGVGWMEEEFLALGLNTYHQRGAVSDEYIRIFKALWTEANPSFKGRFHQFSNLGFAPKPVQKPHPPIWVGGHTDAALRRAALLGDAWLPIGMRGPVKLIPDELAQRMAQLREIAAQAGRNPKAIELCFSANVAFGRATQRSKERTPLTGTPEAVAHDLQAYQRVGVKNFVCALPFESMRQLMADLERFARRVMPELR